MLSNIIAHTPVYVWAILAFLIFRGVAAMRDRELSLKALCIIPLVMLGLSLQDISARYGLSGLPLTAWAVGAGLSAALVWRFGDARVSAGSASGLLRVRGSRMPLVLMMSIFLTKYAAAVFMAMQPGLARQTVFAALVCALFGVFNGLFLGRLAAQLVFLQRQDGRAPAAPGEGASA
jgi:hypothetical protein